MILFYILRQKNFKEKDFPMTSESLRSVCCQTQTSSCNFSEFFATWMYVRCCRTAALNWRVACDSYSKYVAEGVRHHLAMQISTKASFHVCSYHIKH